MKGIIKFYSIILFLFLTSFAYSQETDNHRLIVLADMGNEHDELQQMMHLLMCSNEIDVEGLIAVTGKYLRPEQKYPYHQKLHPELFHYLIEGYSKVYKNLQKHANGWHSPEYLTSIVTSGNPGYGIENVGDGKSSEGSELIINAVLNDDSRPVYIVVNAGSNTLAQALWDYRKNHSPEEVQRFVEKLRVFENGSQDNAGAWICSQFPDIYFIRSNYQTYCYAGDPANNDVEIDHEGNMKEMGPNYWQPYEYSGIGQHQWLLENVIGNHGPFGKYYPLRQNGSGKINFMEGGGTIPWLGLMQKGFYSIDHPNWGGWSGRFTKEKKENYWSRHLDIRKDEKQNAPFYTFVEDVDKWIDPRNGDVYHSIFTPVYRWREAFYNDFKCRMDWCLAEYEDANHHPVAALEGDKSNTIIYVNTKSNETLSFDASASFDPDEDKLSFNWWIYNEAGTYPGLIGIDDNQSSKLELKIPEDAKGKEIHLILEVKDMNNIASLFDYRRIVINVK
jgi:hypothetical protein